jgi:hypothetical protein
MAPCTAKSGDDCPLYNASGKYVDALEVVQGGLGGLGIESGSHVEVGTSCTRDSG